MEGKSVLSPALENSNNAKNDKSASTQPLSTGDGHNTNIKELLLDDQCGHASSEHDVAAVVQGVSHISHRF